MSFNRFSNIKNLMWQIPINAEVEKYLAFNADNEIVSTYQAPEVKATSSGSSADAAFPYIINIEYDVSSNDQLISMNLPSNFPTPREAADYRENDSVKFAQFIKNTYLIIKFVQGPNELTITTPLPPLGFINGNSGYIDPILSSWTTGQYPIMYRTVNNISYYSYDYYYFYGDLEDNAWIFGLGIEQSYS